MFYCISQFVKTVVVVGIIKIYILEILAQQYAVLNDFIVFTVTNFIRIIVDHWN